MAYRVAKRTGKAKKDWRGGRRIKEDYAFILTGRRREEEKITIWRRGNKKEDIIRWRGREIEKKEIRGRRITFTTKL